MTRATRIALVFLVLWAAPVGSPSAGADVRRRWYVDFEYGVPKKLDLKQVADDWDAPALKPDEQTPQRLLRPNEYQPLPNQQPENYFQFRKPSMAQVRDLLGNVKPCWFVAFTLHNPLDQYVPIQVDLMLHTDQGRDYHQDVVRVDPAAVARGKFYSSVVQAPEIELQVIRQLERFGNRNEEMQRERVRELKRENKYLNPAELRRKQVLNPREVVTGLAVFQDVDRHSDTVELIVSGLWDVVKVDKVEPQRTYYVYENRAMHVLYDMPGDEFARETDVLTLRLPRTRWWEVQPLGPSADKETLRKLIDALEAEDPRPDPKVKPPLATMTYGPTLRRAANEALKAVAGEDFGFDPVKSPAQNLEAVRLWKEWWVKNSEKLVYNDRLNRFEIKPQEIPGATPVKIPYVK